MFKTRNEEKKGLRGEEAGGVSICLYYKSQISTFNGIFFGPGTKKKPRKARSILLESQPKVISCSAFNRGTKKSEIKKWLDIYCIGEGKLRWGDLGISIKKIDKKKIYWWLGVRKKVFRIKKGRRWSNWKSVAIK